MHSCSKSLPQVDMYEVGEYKARFVKQATVPLVPSQHRPEQQNLTLRLNHQPRTPQPVARSKTGHRQGKLHRFPCRCCTNGYMSPTTTLSNLSTLISKLAQCACERFRVSSPHMSHIGRCSSPSAQTLPLVTEPTGAKHDDSVRCIAYNWQ